VTPPSPSVDGRVLALAGVLCFGSDALVWLAGPPPRGEVVQWARDAWSIVAASNELLGVSGALFAPAASAAAARLAGSAARAVHALLLATSAVLLGVCVVQGRLVYPVYGLLVEDEASATLVVTLYFGGLHLARLLFAAVLVVASASWWRSEPVHARLGLVAAVLTVVASFPDAMPAAVALATQAAFPAWCVATGLRRVSGRGDGELTTPGRLSG